jgi:hypothetical protein
MYGNSSPTLMGNLSKLSKEEKMMGINRYHAIKKCIRPNNEVFDQLVGNGLRIQKSIGRQVLKFLLMNLFMPMRLENQHKINIYKKKIQYLSTIFLVNLIRMDS